MTFTDNHYKVLTCLSQNRFHTIAELSEDSGLSCVAIYKYLQSFSKLGLEITAMSHKGYRLNRKLELLSASQIKKGLDTNALSLLTTLEIYPQISSTNRYLGEMMETKAQSGHVCFAESQTHGRGRRGRQWISPFGANIYLSLSWLFEKDLASLSGLSLVIGIAVVRALTEMGVHNIALKWPNDIYWQNKKLGGILIEISNKSQAVIGLGLNLYLPKKQTMHITQPWTDLDKIITKTDYSRNHLASLLLNHLLAVIVSFEKKTLRSYLSEWRSYDCMQGQEVFIYRGQQQFKGIIEGIDDNGMLLFKESSGMIKTFASAEVSFRKNR